METRPPETAFDLAAGDYDQAEAANWIVQRMRATSVNRLRATFPLGSRLLDIGAGTGTEAIALASEGRALVAVEPSRAMLDRLDAKAAAADVAIASHMLPARRVADLVETHGRASFDGAYSSFGALNLEPDLAPVADGLARLIRPGGRLVLSLMAGWPLPEIALHLLRLRLREAFRRRADTALVPVAAGIRSPTYFHRPRRVREAFAPTFVIDREQALALLLPPPYAWSQLRLRTATGIGRRALDLLDRLDSGLSRLGSLADLGDHHVFFLSRRQ